MIPVALLGPAILRNWRLIAGGLAAVAVAGIIGLAYRHYTGLVADNGRLQADVSTLRSAVSQEQATNRAAREALEKWRVAEKAAQKLRRQSETVAAEAQSEARKLHEAFDQTNLSADALVARRDLDRLNGLLERETAPRSHNGD